MNSRRSLHAAVAALVFAGGASLPLSAEVASRSCSDVQWAAAIATAAAACGGQASIVADCVDGQLQIREIYCY